MAVWSRLYKHKNDYSKQTINIPVTVPRTPCVTPVSRLGFPLLSNWASGSPTMRISMHITQHKHFNNNVSGLHDFNTLLRDLY